MCATVSMLLYFSLPRSYFLKLYDLYNCGLGFCLFWCVFYLLCLDIFLRRSFVEEPFGKRTSRSEEEPSLTTVSTKHISSSASRAPRPLGSGRSGLVPAADGPSVQGPERCPPDARGHSAPQADLCDAAGPPRGPAERPGKAAVLCPGGPRGPPRARGATRPPYDTLLPPAARAPARCAFARLSHGPLATSRHTCYCWLSRIVTMNYRWAVFTGFCRTLPH